MYLGRVIGFGLDKKGRPVALYAFSSADRKEARARKLRQKVRIDYKENDSFHNAMIAAQNGLMHLADGPHCDTICENIRNVREDVEKAIKYGLDQVKKFGRSCRLAAVVDGFCTEPPVYIGRAGEGNILVKGCEFIRPGHIYYISSTKCKSEVENLIPSCLSDIVRSIDIEGETAQNFADAFFEWMDRDTIYCTAAGLFDPDIRKWEIAVRNR